VATERWFARGRRPLGRRVLVVGAVLVATVVELPTVLPIWPVRDLHARSTSADLADMVGWPELARLVAHDAELTPRRAPPTNREMASTSRGTDGAFYQRAICNLAVTAPECSSNRATLSFIVR